MNNKWIQLCGILVTVLPVVQAMPVPVVTVPELVEAADNIVVGEVLSTWQSSSATVQVGLEERPASIMAAVLRVHDVLKGPPYTGDLTVIFVKPDGWSGYMLPSIGQTAIYFLRQSDGSYSFVSPYRPSVVGMATDMIDGGGLFDRLSHSVEAVVRSPQTSSRSKRAAIKVLAEIPGNASRDALRSAAAIDNELPLRLEAIAALLERNDISMLPVAAETLLNTTEEVQSEVRRRVMVGISDAVTDPQGVPTLVRLLRKGDTLVRQAAASALAKIDSHSAIAALGEALDDPDHEVRFSAVMGLANITRNVEWKPNVLDFRDREKEIRYLEYWREWRAKHPQ